MKLNLQRLSEVRAMGNETSPLWLSALGELDWLIEIELTGGKIETKDGKYECL